MTPHIHVISLGGTIAMSPQADNGIAPALDAQDLLDAVPELVDVARVSSEALFRVPSGQLTLDDVLVLAERIRRVGNEGVTGVVVTQGTDTIEEVAFALDLVHDAPFPVVVTGALRAPTAPGSDGPANLIDAVRTAADPNAPGRGVLVVLNETIHAARFVHKGHTSRPDAFRSTDGGPVGSVTESRVRWYSAAPSRMPAIRPSARLPSVLVVPTWLGDDGALLDAALATAAEGIIVDGLGAGHVPAALVPALSVAAARMPVVLCSRTGEGHTFRNTYGFPGSERDLLSRGVMWGGRLDARKARVLVTLSLAEGLGRAALADRFAAMAG